MINRNKLLKFQIYSVIFSVLLGTLLHFLYNFTSNNKFIALFSNINESTWEHLKLLFFPMLITGIIGYFIYKDIFPSFLCSKTLGILFSLLFIITFFFTYSGIIGTNYAVINILIFILSIILGEYMTYKLTLTNIPCNRLFYVLILIIFLILFSVFTFIPPKINLFKDPINNYYGIFKSF